MNFEDLVDWLFERATMKPQLGFAGADKRAWCWIPGSKPLNHETATRAIKHAPLRGCTQLAYESLYEPMAVQQCEICWVGLDVDAEDNPGIDLTRVDIGTNSMSRTSCSGKGLHIIHRLTQPVACAHATANRIIKTITAPLVTRLERKGLKVCKADRRMFWLHGGENRILHQCDSMSIYIPQTQLEAPPQPPVPGPLQLSPIIQKWAQALNVPPAKKSCPVYVGDVVSLLRSLGETVFTTSSMRGNGQLNGYIDFTEFSISLWSYADGHTIWAFEDIEGQLA